MSNLLVVKLGGADGVDLSAGCQDLVALLDTERRPAILVHGVSAAADRLAREVDHPVRTLTSPAGHSSRYIDRRMRDLFVQAADAVNGQILACLRNCGIDGVGLTGANTVIRARRKRALRAVMEGRVRIVRDDYSGQITGVDSQQLYGHLDAGRLPVLPPLAGSSDGLLNIDGDRAAAAIAAALGAEDLVILSNVRGLYRDYPQPDSIVQVVTPQQRDCALDWAQGRMKRKVLAANDALAGGVARVIIADGRAQQPLQQALAGAGTVFLS